MRATAIFQSIMVLCGMILSGSHIDAQSSQTTVNILEYFTEAEGDGLNIIWAHAVNSQAELDQSLADDTMMLEADVSAENNTGIPIMAHPPDVYSDLTLDEWVDRTAETDKGMKIDFKDISVLEDSLAIILTHEDDIHQPLWLNADIVHGPNSPREPIPPVEFISTINNGFPEVVLSLGWTTHWEDTAAENMYTWTMIFDVLFYSYPCKQPVTFPVRAVWSVTSWDKFVMMIGIREDFTVTVWSGANDDVDVDGLVQLRLNSEMEKVYYDLPDPLMQEFRDALAALPTVTPSPRPTGWDSNLWKAIVSGAIGDNVYLSTSSFHVGIVGANGGALVESRDQYKPQTGNLDTVKVTGKLQFVNRADGTNYGSGDGLQVYLRTSGVSNLKVVQDGLRIYIGRDGELRLESVAATTSDPVTGNLGPSDCYSFEISDSGEDSSVTAKIQPVECTDGTGTLPTNTDPVTLSLQAKYDTDYFYIVMAKSGNNIDLLLEDVSVPTVSSASSTSSSFALVVAFFVAIKILIIH
ncbi:protein FAM151A-like [Ptychodera flava]|uniref:protein FAM151A-like n=1 Tax=Ptychodera flava TaxID=63121 RepID=UPI00396A5DB1